MYMNAYLHGYMFCLFYIVKWTILNIKVITLIFSSFHQVCSKNMTMHLTYISFLITQQEKRKIIRMDHRSYIKKLQCFGG